MKKYSAIVFITILCCACTGNKKTTSNEWIQLFDGKNLDNWTVKIHHHEVGVNFGNTFRVEDGIIKVRYDQYGDFNEQFAHLYYQTTVFLLSSQTGISLRGEPCRKAHLHILY